jgi:hypothetical protein
MPHPFADTRQVQLKMHVELWELFVFVSLGLGLIAVEDGQVAQ